MITYIIPLRTDCSQAPLNFFQWGLFPCFSLHFAVLARILINQFNQNPLSFRSDHPRCQPSPSSSPIPEVTIWPPSLLSGRISLGQFMNNLPPLPCSLTINSHLWYWELSSVSFPHCKIPPQWLLLAITALLLNKVLLYYALCFPAGSLVKNLSASAGDKGLIPGLGKSPGERNSNPLQYSYLGNPWTEEPSSLQSMRVRKSQTWLRD